MVLEILAIIKKMDKLVSIYPYGTTTSLNIFWAFFLISRFLIYSLKNVHAYTVFTSVYFYIFMPVAAHLYPYNRAYLITIFLISFNLPVYLFHQIGWTGSHLNCHQSKKVFWSWGQKTEMRARPALMSWM